MYFNVIYFIIKSGGGGGQCQLVNLTECVLQSEHLDIGKFQHMKIMVYFALVSVRVEKCGLCVFV